MDRELTITPILLNHQLHPSPNAWVKLLIAEPTEADIVATRGKMYAVLSLSSKAEIDFTPIMELIIETLHQRYFGTNQGGILQVLESTLDAIHKQLLLAGQQDKRLSAGFSFDVLVAVNWGTVLYLGQLGSSRACLLREAKLHDIDEGEQRATSLYLSSGVIKAGDKFLLATGQLLNKFNRKQVLHHLSLGNDTLAQSLEQQLDHNPNSLESGIILLVDIKQVPSAKDEALQIFNADSMAPEPRLSATLKNLPVATSAAISKARSAAQALWGWKLFSRLPGLPLVIIFGCLLILLGSIVYKYTYTGPQASSQVNIGPIVAQLQDTLDQAQQVASVNPDRATDLLNQMEPTLSQALSSSHDPKLTAIATQRQHLQEQLLNIQTLSSHPVAQTDNQPVQPKLVQYQNNLYFLTTKQQLAKIQSDSVQTVATNLGLFSANARLAATTVGLAVAQPGSVTLINSNGQKTATANLTASQLLAAAAYQANVYALSGDGQLYKFAAQDTQLSEATGYFPANLSSDGLVDVAIDGAVYILRRDGSITKYLSGRPQTLTLERANLIQGARAIITDADMDNLYILMDHSLLAWSKEGQYLGQYKLSDNAKWQAATVDGQHKKLYILTDGQIVETDLP
jgi:hypothetical protein